MAGLLDFLNTDDGRLGLGLLAAGGPSATPMGFGQRIQSAFQGQDAYKTGALQRQDLAQQIQLRNIGLQQQQQEWALQLPMLQAMAQRMNGGQTAPGAQSAAPSQPDIPASGGGLLGSGTYGIPAGGQSASAPAAQAPQQGSTSGGTMFPGVPDNVAFPTAAFGGFKAVLPLINSYNAPTDLMKTLTAAGYQPGSPEWNQAIKDNIDKSNYVAPVNARPGSILRDPKTGLPFAFNPHIPEGSTPSFDASGNVIGMTQIPGALGAISGAERAKTLGVGEATPTVVYDPSGKPTFSTKATDVRRAGGGQIPGIDGDPNSTSTPYQRAGSDVASLQREIDGVKRSMAPAATKRMQLDILNAELVKAQAGASGAPAPAAGAVTPQQAPGLVPNADAAQKASAQTMQASYGRLQASNSTAQNALDVIDKMLGIAGKKNSFTTAGVLGTHQSAVNPDAAEYEKQRANLITQLSAQNGTNGTDAGRALTGEAVPDFGKPKSAIADGLGTLRNQTVVQQLKTNFLTPIFQAGDSKKYTTLENEFDQHISPSMVPLLTMPSGAAKKKAVQDAAQNPTLRAKLNWAIENGLLK